MAKRRPDRGQSRRSLDELARLWTADRDEIGLLLAYLTLIVILSFVLFDMLVAAYEQRETLYEVTWTAIDAVPVEGVDPVLAFPVSLTVTLVLVMVLDSYKRFQGLLLLVGLGIGGAILVNEGLLLANIRWTDPMVFVSVLLGFVAVVVGTGAVNVFSESVRPPYEFERVPQVVLVAATVAVLVGYWEAHGLAVPAGSQSKLHLASFVLPVVLYQFTSYENRVTPLIVGPARSGKTWTMGGLNYSLVEEEVLTPYSVPTGANFYLSKITESIRQRAFDDIDPNQPNELHALEFQYLHGRIFPKRVQVRTLDYAGELLERVSENLVEDVSDRSPLYSIPFVTPRVKHRYLSKLPLVDSPWDLRTDSLEEVLELTRDRIDEIEADGGVQAMTEARQGARNVTEIELLTEAIHHADTLVFILPMDNFTEFVDASFLPRYSREMQMAERIERAKYLAVYATIASRYEDKDAFTLATMADLVRQDYENREGRRALENYEGFAEYVQRQVIGNRAEGFTNQLEDPTIYPVYWEVDESDPTTPNGNIKPMLDLPDSRPPLRGTEAVLDRLGR